jgi:DNA-binding MarR family transcriptional regulator
MRLRVVLSRRPKRGNEITPKEGSANSSPDREKTMDEKAVRRAQAVLTAFQAVNESMPIQVASTFLTVALYEGRSLREYCDLTGVPQSTMSRHLLDLGPRNRKKEPGYQLLDQRQDAEDYRRNVYSLTPKGRGLLKTMTNAMEKHS